VRTHVGKGVKLRTHLSMEEEKLRTHVSIDEDRVREDTFRYRGGHIKTHVHCTVSMAEDRMRISIIFIHLNLI
jgi:hypothetical protein